MTVMRTVRHSSFVLLALALTSCTLSREPSSNECDPERAETCNGLDDDCDGLIDNVLNVVTEYCNGADDDCNGVIDDVDPKPETCNGIDDDCDDIVDEAGWRSDDLLNCGACGNVCAPQNALGVCNDQTCEIASCDDGLRDGDGLVANGCEQTCATTELCNDIDDDCDGKVDEDAGGGDCSAAVIQIAPGGSHTCALREEGEVLCWGSNEYGQLATGTYVSATSPYPVRSLRATQISSGKFHVCALQSDGRIACWGWNEWKQLGAATARTIARPTIVAGIDSVVSLGLGFYHSCALTEDEEVVCWGWNGRGQLGIPFEHVNDVVATPMRVPNLTDVAQVDGGYDSTCARHTNGRVSCWGENEKGQLGDGTTTSRIEPALVETADGEPLEDVAALSVSASHVCVLQKESGEDDGTVLCWGENLMGEIGDGSSLGRLTPVSTGITDAVEVSTGVFFSCARRANGVAMCWGNNAYGQLGNDSDRSSNTPVEVVELNASAMHVDNGDFHTCAIRSDRLITCWGRNENGQLGVGGITEPMLVPVRIGL